MPVGPAGAGRLAALGIVLSGCAGSPAGPERAPAPEPARAAQSFVPVTHPFSVTDSTGKELELAFLGGINTPRPQLLDLDGDKDVDLVFQEYSGRMEFLEHVGVRPDGAAELVHRPGYFGDLDVGEWSRFADYDGDGRLDLFAEWPNSYIRVFRNRGLASGPRFTPLPDTLRDDSGRAIFADRQNIAQFVDLDCDGKLDLFIGRIAGTILHYELVDPKAEAPRFRLVSERFQDLLILTGQSMGSGGGTRHGANTMAFVDHDRDGDLDLFWGDFFEPGLLLFENTGSCAETRLRRDPIRFPPESPLLTSGYNAPTFGDLDGDGKLDLLVGVLGGSYDPIKTTIANLHHFAEGSGGGFQHRSTQFLPMIDVGSESIPVLVDLDGDGDLDFLIANKIEPFERKTARIYRFENTGTRTAPTFRMRGPLETRGAYHLAPAFGDLDGDGTAELLLGSYGNRLALYRRAGPLSEVRYELADSAFVSIRRGSNTTPALGDLDADGDLDLLVGRGSGYLSFYRNQGGPKEPRFELESENFLEIKVNHRAAPAVFDIDRDGDLDLLIGSDAGRVILYRNRGTTREHRLMLDSTFVLAAPSLAAPALGDLDGDGSAEILIGTSGGGVLFMTGAGRRAAGLESK